MREGLKEGISEDPESREFYCDVIIDEAAKNECDGEKSSDAESVGIRL